MRKRLEECRRHGAGKPVGQWGGRYIWQQWERRIIGQRTREALAVRKAQGVRLGRPVTLKDDVATRIRSLRGQGRTLAAITDLLNGESVPTAQGGARWHPSTVRAVLRRTAHADERVVSPAGGRSSVDIGARPEYDRGERSIR